MFYPRPYLFAILTAALGYAQEPPPIVDPEPAPSPIEAAWLNLEAPNAIFRSSAGLALSVRNLGPETVVRGSTFAFPAMARRSRGGCLSNRSEVSSRVSFR